MKRINRHALRIGRFAGLFLAAMLAGCASGPAEVAANKAALDAPRASTIDVAVAPRKLVERVAKIVSEPPIGLGVARRERGTILTNWKDFQGEFHIARYWQERTRYRIDITPDWDDPSGKSRLSVTTETQQRRTDAQNWDGQAELSRPERSRELIAQIETALRSEAN